MGNYKEKYDSFEFKGKTYPLNTIVKVKKDVYTEQLNRRYVHLYPLVLLVNHYLDNIDIHRYVYAVYTENGGCPGFITKQTPDEIIEYIIEVPSTDNKNEFKKEYYKDSEVKGMFIGWIIYIIAMFFSLVFINFFVAWAGISLIFFVWRNQKLQKPQKIMYGYDISKKVRELNNER